MPGCRVLTRPSSISGKPVTSATSVTGRPAARKALRGASRGEQFHAEAGETLGELDQARLVGRAQERAAHTDHRCP